MSPFIYAALGLAIIISSAGGLELRIKPTGKTHVKPQGASIVFTCVDRSTEEDGGADDGEQAQDEVVFKWFDSAGQEILEKSGRRYVEVVDDGLKLYITNIERDDAGSYTCKAADKEESVTLLEYEAIGFANCTAEQHPRIHSDAVIHCNVTGNPKPTVSWMFQGKRIPISKRGGAGRYTMLSHGLQITDVTPLADNGTYTCRAEVDEDGRYDERQINVTVHIPPTISPWSGLKDSEAIQGSNHSMRCTAEGLPAPSYEFLKNNVTVVGSASIVVDKEKGRLDFAPVQKSDEGQYTCRAHNDVGDARDDGFLKVLVPPLVHDLANVTLSEHETLELTCRSHGDPYPTLSFVKDGKEYSSDPDEQDPSGLVKMSGSQGEITLTIAVVQISDAGIYTCKSSNKIGNHQLSSTVVVNYKPRFAPDNKLVVYSWAGARHNLTCNALGLPAPTMEWKRMDTALVNNATYHLYHSSTDNSSTSSLQVSVQADNEIWIFHGKYVCVATNSLDSEEQEFDLLRAIPPNKPSGISVVERLADSLTIEVGPPVEDGGIPVIGYTLEYFETKPKTAAVLANKTQLDASLVSADDNVIEAIQASEDRDREDDGGVEKEEDDTNRPLTTSKTLMFDGNRAKISDLKPETSYLLKVKARNQVGAGSAIEQIETTDRRSEPGQVSIKSSPVSLDGDKYTLKWEVLNTGGAPIIEYEVNYAKINEQPGSAGGGQQRREWQTVYVNQKNAMEGQYRLADLIPQSHYVLKMRARNDIGWSQPTPEFNFQTREDSLQVAEPASVTGVAASLGAGLVIVIVAIILLAVVLIVDVYRYRTQRAGCIALIRTGKCRPALSGGENGMDESEKEHLHSTIKQTELNDYSSSSVTKLQESPILVNF